MGLIMAFDPGVTTGVAWLDVQSPTLARFGSTQLDEHGLYKFVDKHCEEIEHSQVEKFIINQATIRKTVVYDSVYIIGYLRYAAWRCGFTMDFTKPADVMAPFNDAALKRKGWHKPGLDHANDAARHLAHRLVKTRRISGSEFLPKK